MNVTETLPQIASQPSGATTTIEVVKETRDRQQPSRPATSPPSDAPRHDGLNQFALWIRSDAAEDTAVYLHRANTHHDGE